jgi:hypothetical protein
MKSPLVQRAFSALMLFVLVEFQAMAIRGGPYEVGTISDPYRIFDGTYSLTLIPEENLLDETIDDTTTPVTDLETYDPKNPGSALGFAYFLAPAGGVARGSIGLFYNGRLLIGNMAGSIRPSDGAFSFLAQLLAPSPNNFQAFDVTASNSSSTGTSTPTSGSTTGGTPTGNTGTPATGTASTNSAASQSSVTTTTTLAGAYADGQISGKATVTNLKGSFQPVKMITLDGRATIRVVTNPENVLGDLDSEMILRFYVTGSRQSTETDYSADALALPFWVNSLSNTNLSLSALNRNTSAATQPTNTNQPDRLPALPANATTTAGDQRRVTPGSATFIQSIFKPVAN